MNSRNDKIRAAAATMTRDLLEYMTLEQIQAVYGFAATLKTGLIHPAAFKLIGDYVAVHEEFEPNRESRHESQTRANRERPDEAFSFTAADAARHMRRRRDWIRRVTVHLDLERSDESAEADGSNEPCSPASTGSEERT